MRPDEHKKKRSSAYKKKHDLAQKSQPKTRETKWPSANTGNGNDTLPGAKALQLHEDGDESTPEEVSAFSRKPIESNWDRYEPISDEEDDQGTDFNVLLSFAGDASSHIKLKYEEEWETAQTDSDFLAIDQKHLSSTLEQIPFAEKYNLTDLDIDPALFEYLTKINDSEFLQKPSSVSSALLSSSKANDLGFNFSNTFKAEQKIEEVQPVLNEQKSEDIVSDQDDKIHNPECDLQPHTSAEVPGNVQIEKPITEDDEIVDKLLSSRISNNLSKNLVESQSGTDLEECQSEDSPKSAAAEEKDGEVGDLEDWLDSIL